MNRLIVMVCLTASFSAMAEDVSASCDKARIGQCTDFLGPLSEKAAKLCESTSGVVKRGAACTADDVVGTCTTKNPENVPIRVHYRRSSKTKDPREMCVNSFHGTWSDK